MKKILYIAFLLLTSGFILPMDSSAQNKEANINKRSKSVTKKQSPTLKVNSKVCDMEGNPITDASVISGEGAYIVHTDISGSFSITARKNSTLIIEAIGYEPFSVNLALGAFPDTVHLVKSDLFASSGDNVSRADGGTVAQRNLIGTGGKLQGEKLSTYPDILLGNSLQGRMAGLIVVPTVGGLGNNSSEFYLRGLHGMENNQAIVVIDGVERSFDELISEEIESIELMKDPTTKILYGPRAANGILWVTTKRGKENRRTIRVSAEAGITKMTRTPDYLNSYQYAQLYNEARQNDGYPNFYSQQQLSGYKNSTGANDFLSPDADYYNEFLRKDALYRKISVEVNGGSENVQYALIIGYNGNGGYEKVGETPDFNRMNIRGNLDVKVNDYLSVVGGISAQLGIRNWSSKNGSEVFTALSTHRSNEYPFTINPAQIGLPADSLGLPTFGASMQKPNNLYADMLYGGFSSERNLNSQANLGLDFTLDKILKGLKASAYVTFDNYNYFMNGQRNIHPTYFVKAYTDEDGKEQYFTTQMRKRELQSDQSRLGESTIRSNSWRVNAQYATQLGPNQISASAAYNYYKREVIGTSQDIINANYTMRLNYSFNNKYLVEADLAYMGSNLFDNGNKFFLAPAFGVGWVLSNESFFKSHTKINFLKLKASFGVLGYDGNVPAPNYRTAWEDGGTAQLGEQNKTTTSHITNFIRMGNPELKWEKSAEFNVGLEGLFLKNRLFAELNYFNEVRSDIIGFRKSEYSDMIGSFISYSNMGKVKNHGFEATLNWNDRVGDFVYKLGLNFMWSKNKLTAWDEVAYSDYLCTVGKSTDAMMGYRALGLFGKDVPLAGHPSQFLGSYQEGDIAYADLNNDKMIDDRDKEMLGNSFPHTNVGVEVELKYKQWGLYILGVYEGGVSKWLNNTYYWNKGEDKYSVMALDRYHPIDNPEGNYPRLTTTNGDNNFRDSSFWIQKADFFRLRNVELSYTLPNKFNSHIFQNIKVFARGSNLFVLSGIKDLDPELPDAGVTNYPVSMAITGGISVQF